jgi:hypothetical protein
MQGRLQRAIYALLLLACWCTGCNANKGPRIAILTISTGPIATPYVAQTVINKAMYANRNGYRFLLFHHLDISRPPSWSKILALKTIIHSQDYDWLMWLDGDMVVTNFRARVELMLPRRSAIDLILSRDCDNVNMGAFIIRASKTALEILEEIYSGPHVTKKILEDSWWEQKSFINLYA